MRDSPDHIGPILGRVLFGCCWIVALVYGLNRMRSKPGDREAIEKRLQAMGLKAISIGRDWEFGHLEYRLRGGPYRLTTTSRIYLILCEGKGSRREMRVAFTDTLAYPGRLVTLEDREVTPGYDKASDPFSDF